MRRDTVTISAAARNAVRDHTLIEDGADTTMRESEEPLVRTGQGSYEQWLDDGDETWIDVVIVIGIIGALALLFFVATF